MTWVKWIAVVLGVLAALGLVVWMVGRSIPREHRASCRARFRAAPERVFARLTDVEGLPTWRSDVRSARRTGPVGGKPAYVEETRFGPITYAVEASDPPRRLVLCIADEALPYGGTWTFELEPRAEETLLTITEEGFIRPAFFRFLARFVFGYHATMQGYLESLGKALGSAAVVERVE